MGAVAVLIVGAVLVLCALDAIRSRRRVAAILRDEEERRPTLTELDLADWTPNREGER